MHFLNLAATLENIYFSIFPSHSGSFLKVLNWGFYWSTQNSTIVLSWDQNHQLSSAHRWQANIFWWEIFSCFSVPLWLLSRFLRFLFHAKNFRARCFRFPWYVGKNVVCHIILEENQDPIFKRLSTSFEFGSNEKSMRNNCKMSIYNSTS